MRHFFAVACAVACALAAHAACAQTTALGRLFFSPEERARLAAARQGKDANGAARAVADPARWIVSGVARSSRGGLVAWIDGQLVPDGATHAGYTVQVAGGGVTLRRAGQPAIWLPVGLPLRAAGSVRAGAKEAVR